VFFLAPAAAGPGLGCPVGDAVAFLTSGGAALTCLSRGVQTFKPLLSNVTLAGDLFTPIAVPVFGLAWPAAPTGAWLAGIALTPVGAFSDGRLNPLADLVIATARVRLGAVMAEFDLRRRRRILLVMLTTLAWRYLLGAEPEMIRPLRGWLGGWPGLGRIA
jgi:hypothetical protein